MAEVLVVGSKVKAFVKSKGLNMSGTMIDSLSAKVEALLNDAAKRTQANGRKTMRAEDL